MSEKEIERNPILYLEVNLEGKKRGKLIIYKNDDYERVVKEFSFRNSLGKTKEKKLMEVVKAQLLSLSEDSDEKSVSFGER